MKFAVKICGLCGMKLSHVGEKPSSNISFGELIAQDRLEKANQSWQSGNQTTISALKVLKVKEEKFHFFFLFWFVYMFHLKTGNSPKL